MSELTSSAVETGLPFPLPFPLMHACTSSLFLQTLILHSPTAIVALDTHHCYRMANPAFFSLFGYTAEDLLAGDFDEKITAPGTEAAARRLSALVLQGHKVQETTQRRRNDGVLIDVEIFGIPLIEDGKLAGVYGLYQDLTERTQAQTALRAASKQLEMLQQAERDRACAARGFNRDGMTQLELTRRERHLLELLAQGRTSKAIAAQLGLSVRTVESHRTSINQKCGFRSVADLVCFALRHGIISPEQGGRF